MLCGYSLIIIELLCKNGFVVEKIRNSYCFYLEKKFFNEIIRKSRICEWGVKKWK